MTADRADPTAGNEAELQPIEPLVAVEGLSRSFGEVHALQGADLFVSPREVVGLIGENGAGKSTLLNILCGVDQADSGRVLLRGEPVRFRSYSEATHHGVFRIFQDLSLVPTASVAENLFLSHEDKFSRAGIILTSRMRKRASAVLERFGHGTIDPSRLVGSYDFSTRQVIEIIRSFALTELLDVDMPLILLDEPTAGLAENEVEFFMQLVHGVKEDAGVVFVSHRLSELFALSDRVYILRDGVVVGEADPATCTESELHRSMVGRERETLFYKEASQRLPDDATVVKVADFCRRPSFTDVNFSLRRGEILGLAGVMGSGKSELIRALFGDGHRPTGTVAVNGTTIRRRGIRAMIDTGVGYVAPDRAEGVIGSASVAWNVSLVDLTTKTRPLLISLRDEKQAADSQIVNLSIKTPSARTTVAHLSGGNQRKAILGRWLSAGSRILLLDNPTAGVDVGAKEDIYRILRKFVADGGSILLVSDDLNELIGLSNRVLAMKDGRVVAEVPADTSAKPSEADLLQHMV